MLAGDLKIGGDDVLAAIRPRQTMILGRMIATWLRK